MTKKHFITYGTNKFNHSKYRLANQVKELNIFDKIKTYDDKSLSKEFREKHKEILKKERGGGYYIWKFDIINQELEGMNDGDYLVYLDAGCVINKEGLARLNEYFDMLNKSDYGIISFQMPLRELEWTSKQVFNYLGVLPKSDIGNGGQFLGGILVMQKKPHLVKIIGRISKALDDDINLFTDYYKKEQQHEGFKDCRHDQSVSSIIRKQEGSIVLSNETLNHLPNSKKWPIWAVRLK